MPCAPSAREADLLSAASCVTRQNVVGVPRSPDSERDRSRSRSGAGRPPTDQRSLSGSSTSTDRQREDTHDAAHDQQHPVSTHLTQRPGGDGPMHLGERLGWDDTHRRQAREPALGSVSLALVRLRIHLPRI